MLPVTRDMIDNFLMTSTTFLSEILRVFGNSSRQEKILLWGEVILEVPLYNFQVANLNYSIISIP